MKKVISILTLAAVALTLNVAVAQDHPKKATVKDKKAGCEATCTKKDKSACSAKGKAACGTKDKAAKTEHKCNHDKPAETK